jgi:hypothetical protein
MFGFLSSWYIIIANTTWEKFAKTNQATGKRLDLGARCRTFQVIALIAPRHSFSAGSSLVEANLGGPDDTRSSMGRDTRPS